MVLTKTDEVEDIEALTKNLIFRQSLIDDIMVCPKMAAYRHLYSFSSISESGLDTPESMTQMAAILGSAGHDVIELLHKKGRLDYEMFELLEMFSDAYYSRIEKNGVEPIPSPSYDSHEEEFDAKMIDYAAFISGYQKYHRELRHKFISSMHEQQFVMAAIHRNEQYLIYGTIDQVGAYTDGTTTMRDIKFRQNAFKPNYVSLHLKPQLFIYASALRYGVPACDVCKPTYIEDVATMTREISYNGPCEACRKKIKTPEWPCKFPNVCELVWMRDFETYNKAYRGKKAGEFKGKGLYKTFYTQARMTDYLSYALDWCHLFRHGYMPRHPGEACSFWCSYKDRCMSELRGSAASGES
jgi:hypothetical protein